MDHRTPSNSDTSKVMHPIQRATIAEIVEHYLDHPQASSLLHYYLWNASHHCDNATSTKVMQALDALQAYYRDHPHPLAVLHDRIQNDPFEKVRTAAVESIAKHYADAPQTYDWLCEPAHTAKDDYAEYVVHIQSAALTALGDYFSHKPQTLMLLRQLYQNSDNREIRQLALRQIAQHFSHDPQTVALLHNCIQNTSEPTNLRQEALWQIADRYPDESQTLPLLHDYLRQCTLRDTVLAALAKYYPADPQTVLTLHKYARHGSEVAVQWLKDCPHHPETFAVLRERVQLMIDESSYDYDGLRALVECCSDEPQTLSLLMEVIQKRLPWSKNPDKSVLQVALELLIEHYLEHPQTLPFILTLVEQRKDKYFPEVELWILRLSVRHYRDEPRVLPFLKQLAQNHLNAYLRTAALSNMAWGYGNDPETLSFVNQCIHREQDRNKSIRVRDIVHTIGRCCGDNPQTLPWLKEQAQNTTNKTLRHAAIEVLGKYFLSDLEAHDLLSDVAQHETHDKMRLKAFRAIAQYPAATEGDPSDQWPPISMEVPDIPINCGEEYSQLRELLKAQQWQAADQETFALVQQILSRQPGSLEGILTLPSKDLRMIDQLWSSTSWGHFSFSTQREIYLQCGGTLDGTYPGDEIWQTFCKRVGWVVSDFLGSYDDICFHLCAPAGHLPLWCTVSWIHGLAV